MKLSTFISLMGLLLPFGQKLSSGTLFVVSPLLGAGPAEPLPAAAWADRLSSSEYFGPTGMRAELFSIGSFEFLFCCSAVPFVAYCDCRRAGRDVTWHDGEDRPTVRSWRPVVAPGEFKVMLTNCDKWRSSWLFVVFEETKESGSSPTKRGKKYWSKHPRVNAFWELPSLRRVVARKSESWKEATKLTV